MEKNKIDFKKIKLIVLDIDDTLLNREKEISQKVINVIQDATLLGIKIVLASGRPLAKMTIDIYKKIGLYSFGNYFIAYNGACIYDIFTGEQIYSYKLDDKDILKIDNYFACKKINSARYIHIDENVTVINSNKYSYLEYLYNLKDYVEADFKKLKNLYAYKYQLGDEPNIIKELFDSLEEEIKNNYSITITMPCFLEIMNKNVDKYSAILKLSKMLNINEDEIMAIGDSMNDYSMVANAEVGVAMGNAVSEIKQAAKLVVNSCDNDGVFDAIFQVVSSKKIFK